MQEIQKINTLGIIGVGLIGGSFALALKKAGLVENVIGYGRDQQSIQQAKDLGIIDAIVTIEEMGKVADVIMIATPVKAFLSVAEVLAPVLNDKAIVCDVGSTKAEVIQWAKIAFKEKIAQFIPSHPIAGSHSSGPAAAFATLFHERNVIITPLAENKSEDVAWMQALWEACGANVQLLDQAKDHDDIFAAVSHFPHFLAASYMSFMESDAVRRQALHMGGTGFRDFTRIAAGSPEMWRDIFLSNQEAMLAQMNAFEKEFHRIRTLLENKDADQIYQWLSTAAQARRAWTTIPTDKEK
ncbi:prephenate dehydrogenase [Pelistega ratti]|uniref:prephenate dehydrogenase n=1 Tax=Pelistega ratti TaxID=2652177 RepID=UPI001356B9E1|nr:prephenate dehydrogenase/arogenate dehydrogenase family protein [Pelistega ratti]